MAKNSGPKKKQKENTKAKVAEEGFFSKLQAWWKGIISELKKVTWPERNKFITNVAAVLTIIVVATVVILAFDGLINLVFNVTGFYDVKQMPGQAPAPISAPIDPEAELEEAAKEAAEDAAEDVVEEAEDAADADKEDK